MIKVTRFNGEEFVINCDLIEHVEHTPDTVVILTNGHRFVVRESVDEVIGRVVLFKKNIYQFGTNE